MSPHARRPSADDRVRRRPAGPTDPRQLLEGLNQPQREAVVHEGGPLLVVAGAGSGKTRVLTRRIAWLISRARGAPRLDPGDHLHQQGRGRDAERVEDLVGNRARMMWVSHLPLRVRADPAQGDRPVRLRVGRFSIYDAADSKRLMTLVAATSTSTRSGSRPGAVLNWVSQPQERAASTTRRRADAPQPRSRRRYAAAYTEYQRRLREANALDFDDLIMTTVHLLQAFPEVREHYRRRFRHVLVDEYQDTNHAQYALIHELCAGRADAATVVRGRHAAGHRAAAS